MERQKNESVDPRDFFIVFSTADNERMCYKTNFTQGKGKFLDDHFKEAGPSGLSFARGWSLQVIICNHK